MKEKLIWDCYRELFANSEPPADFDELYDKAPTNEIGQKEIPYMDHEIEQEKMDEIISKYQKKLKRPYDKQTFKTTIYLGCSPKTKVHES